MSESMVLGVQSVLGKTPELGDIFQHYKGGKYTYLGSATLESDGTPLTLYKNEGTQKIYARPSVEFFEKVDVNGVNRQRFSLVE